MGLAEKRVVKSFQEEKYPSIKQEIDKICGFDVPIEVNWESIAGVSDTNAETLAESLDAAYFLPLLEGLRSICSDDLGRNALRDSLKKISVAHLTGYTAITFQGGTLSIDHHPTTNISYWPERRDEIVRVLEQAL